MAKLSPLKKAGGGPLEALGMVQLPVRGDGTPVHWEAPLVEAWDMSESAAQATLEEFASVGVVQPASVLPFCRPFRLVSVDVCHGGA